MMESGPVGGIIASARVGETLGFADVISFDMGGTTAKASLVRDGEPTMAPGYYVGGYASGHPVMLPVIDVVEVGAGGGSIAWIDEVGALKVGPQSAGADPGPICYRGGGTEPTITDANVVLGRLDPHNFLGGEMRLDADGARAGIERKIAQPLRMDTVEAAQAIIEIAIAKMSLAVREVSVEKGYDPRDFALVASRRRRPAARLRHRARTAHPDSDRAAVSVAFLGARHAARRRAPRFHPHLLLRSRRASTSRRSMRCTTRWRARRRRACAMSRNAQWQIALDLRYVGQEFTLSVPVSREAIKKGDRQKIRAAFDALYEQRYAHQSPDEPVEMVNIRLAAIGKRPQLRFPRLAKARRRESVTPARRLPRRSAQAGGVPDLSARRARRRRAHRGARR